MLLQQINGNINAIKAGQANIIVTTVDGGFTDTCKVTVSDGLSVKDNKEHNKFFNIYPNPTSDYLNIISDFFSNKIENSNLEIYNQLGEIVLTTDLNSENQSQIYVGDLSSGVYFISFGNQTQMFVRK